MLPAALTGGRSGALGLEVLAQALGAIFLRRGDLGEAGQVFSVTAL